ncbi:MAG: sensor histidine kinase [Cyanobacteria bacterium J06638_7]
MAPAASPASEPDHTGTPDPPSLARVRACLTKGAPLGHNDEDSVRRQWWAALATLQSDFLLSQPDQGGLWLAAPLPALYEPQVLARLQGWVWTPAQLETLMSGPLALLPGGGGGTAAGAAAFDRLPLQSGDGTDPLLIVITPGLQVALCLDGPSHGRRLLVRFEPDVLSEALALIHARLAAGHPASTERLQRALQTLGALRSDPHLAMSFWPRLADRLAAMAPSLTLQPLVQRGPSDHHGSMRGELELLEALTHEVRTPLATIRTVIRSLLRRADLSPVVRQRLEHIDGECTEQIDRFGLIFLAAELQERSGDPGRAPIGDQELARTDLSELLGQLEPLWQRQLHRRGLKLQLAISADLPPVLSDPARLETMLGGLIDRFSRSLPGGSTVRLRLQAAGPRLKLRLDSTGGRDQPAGSGPEEDGDGSRVQAVGPVLSWNAATGSLQLSRQATQRLFQRLGGRLTERNGSGLTVFFPIC